MSSLKRDVQITKRIERQSHCKPLWILYMDGTIICGYLMSEDVERKYESLRKRYSKSCAKLRNLLKIKA